MVCAPVRSIIPSLKLGDYLSVQAHNPCSISHLVLVNRSKGLSLPRNSVVKLTDRSDMTIAGFRGRKAP